MISGILVLGLLSLAYASVPSEPPAYGSPYDEPFEERPQPYSFNIDVKDEYGNTLRRQEVGDDLGNKKGSYGYTDAFGISRQVEYIADDKGFRAVVKTNEPGTDNQNPADVEIISNAVQVPPSYESQPLSDPTFGRPRSAPPPPPINEQPIHSVYSAPAPIGAPTNGYGPVPGPAPATLDRAPLY